MLTGPDQLHPEATSIIACSAVIEEILPYLPPGTDCQPLDIRLHGSPATLNRAIQEAIDTSTAWSDTILLGYGLCSQAVVGLRANACRLVVPKVDDCIAISLGSQAAYRAQSRAEPGTYYLTKGWIQAGENPFDEYDDLVERFGRDRADRVMGQILKHYTRLAFINTHQPGMRECGDYCRRTAQRFGLRFEELPGCSTLIKKMICGPWDDDFVIVPPGRTISFLDFKSAKRPK